MSIENNISGVSCAIPPKAVCLFSGGLDSRLAARLVLDQGIELIALHFESIFMVGEGSGKVSGPQEAAAQLGMEFRKMDLSEELTELVKSPPHGHGSGLNPCIDCRILQLRKAHALMGETGAGFIVTGEVVGQRPMTQRRDMMRHIDKEADVQGLVLRPLSALLLEPTVAEKTGTVLRRRLCSFSGRRRTPQMQLAERLGIYGYPAPAGGCRLREPGYSRRLKELLDHDESSAANIRLLRTGRHFRLSPEVRLVVGRNESENEQIRAHVLDSDALLECSGHAGPTSLLRGGVCEENLICAARITARYGKGRDRSKVEVRVEAGGEKIRFLRVKPAGLGEFDDRLIQC